MKTSVILLMALFIGHNTVFTQGNLDLLWQTALPNAWLQFDDLKPVSAERAKVQKDGLWGIVDLKGNDIIPPKYKSISTNLSYWHPDAPECYWVSFDDVDYGLMDYDGNTIVPIAYRQITYLENGHFRVCTFRGECREFLVDGKDVTPEVLKKYRCSLQQKGGLTAASKDGKLYGFADTLGNWVVEPSFTFYYWDDCGIWFVYGETGGIQVVLPQNPSWKSPEFERAQCFGNGFYGNFGDGVWHEFDYLGNSTGRTKTNFNPGIFYFQGRPDAYRETGFYGLISDKGEVILSPVYADINVRKIGKKYFSIVQNSERKFGVFYEGKWLIPCDYDNIINIGSLPIFSVVLGDSTFIFDTLGQVIDFLPFQAKEDYGNYFIDFSNKKHFWTPGAGLASLPPNTSVVTKINTVFKIKSFNGKYSVVDEKGQIVLNDYDAISVHNELDNGIGCYLLRKNGLWGIKDPTLQYGFEPQYTTLREIINGRFLAKKEVLFGLVDYKNQELLPFEFDDAKASHGIISFRKNGKWGIFDINTLEKITDFEFEEIPDVKPEFLVGKKDGLYGLYTKEGKPLSNEAFTKPPSSFYQKGEFLFGEENQKAIYSAKGVRMTEHEFSSMYYLENQGNNQLYLQANLPKGGHVYFDKNLKESKRAHYLIACPNGSVAVEQNGLWRIEDSEGNKLSDRNYKSLLQIGLDRFYFQFFAGQDNSGTWHIVDIVGRSVYQFEAEEVGYLGGRGNIEQVYFKKSGKRYLLEMPGFITKELKYENGEEGLVQSNGKYGYVDEAGKVIVPCEYDEVTDVGESNLVEKRLIAGKKNRHYDIYDGFSGKLLVEDVNGFKKYGWPERVFYSKSGKTGEIWPQLGRVGELRYSSLAHETLGGKSFYIVAYASADSFAVLDRNLEEVIPPAYKSIQVIEFGNFLLKDFNGKQWLFDGKKLRPTGEGNAVVKVLGNKLLVKKNDKLSLVDLNGKLLENLPNGWLANRYQVGQDEYVLRIELDKASYFCYTDEKHPVIGPLQLSKFLEPTTFIVEKSNKYGIYDLVDGYLSKPIFDTIQEVKNFGYLVKKQGKWGVLDKAGQVVLPTKFDITPFVATDHLIGSRNGKFYFYSTTGKQLFKESFDYALPFQAHLAPVCSEGKWGYIDKRGKMAIPYQFDYAHTFFSDWYPIAWVMKGDSTYFIDVAGKPTSNLPSGVTRAEDKSYLFDPTLLFPLERQLHSVKIGSYCNFTIFLDTLKKAYGIVSYNGKILLEPEAQTVKWFQENSIALAWFQQDGKYGFLTRNGKTIPAEYDKYELQDFRSLRVSKGGKDFYLMEDGSLRPVSK